MMRIVITFWHWLAHVPWVGKMMIKIAIFAAILITVLFPNPALLFRQIAAYSNTESLIQTDFPGIEQINQDVNAALPAGVTRQQEFQAIQRYVYHNIPYAYDWDNWGNVDFWPTAAQVWARRQEDCDGQAVLAASILRARGFESARLVGNIRHIWVAVDEQELMSPDREQTLVREGGKVRLKLPSWELLLGSTALYFSEFPAFRNALLLIVLIGLCYHPGRSRSQFLGLTVMGLLGFLLVHDWARHAHQTSGAGIDVNFVGGGFLLCGALLLAMIIKKESTTQRDEEPRRHGVHGDDNEEGKKSKTSDFLRF